MRVLILLALATVATAFPPINTNDISNDVVEPNENNLVVTAHELGLTTLLEYASAAGLADTLANQGPFTIFAPTNEAFAKLDKHVVHLLTSNVTALTEVLLYHIYDGEFKSSAIENELLLPSKAAGAINIRLNVYEETEVVTATGSKVTKADQVASNGIIHVIDRVMYPIPRYDMVDLITMCPAFSTLLTAVQAAGLTDALRGDALTLFAPSNKAFAKIPPPVIDDLLANKTALTRLLTYHVIPGTTYSVGLSDNDEIPTLEGSDVKVTITGGYVIINEESKVTYANSPVSNGVVHVIDTVLMPPSDAGNV